MVSLLLGKLKRSFLFPECGDGHLAWLWAVFGGRVLNAAWFSLLLTFSDYYLRMMIRASYNATIYKIQVF